jgi:hypothetical protein
MLRKLEIHSDNRQIKDEDVACNIVSRIFGSVDLCLKEDKSKVKLSLFSKSFIKGLLNNKVENGVNNFIRNMHPNDVNILLNDIQTELSKRRK